MSLPVHAQNNITPGTSESESKSALDASPMYSAAQGTRLAPIIVDEPCSDLSLTRDFRSLSVATGSPLPARRFALAVAFLPSTSSMPAAPHTTRRPSPAPSVPPPEYPLTPASMRDDTPVSTTELETQEPLSHPPVRAMGYTRQSLSYSSLPAPSETALGKAPAAPVVEQHSVPVLQDDAAHNVPPLPPALHAFLETIRKLPELPALGAFLVARGVRCDVGLDHLCTMRHETLAEDLGVDVKCTFSNVVWMALMTGLTMRGERMKKRARALY